MVRAQPEPVLYPRMAAQGVGNTSGYRCRLVVGKLRAAAKCRLGLHEGRQRLFAQKEQNCRLQQRGKCHSKPVDPVPGQFSSRRVRRDSSRLGQPQYHCCARSTGSASFQWTPAKAGPEQRSAFVAPAAKTMSPDSYCASSLQLFLDMMACD
jgi:hypothetical protein